MKHLALVALGMLVIPLALAAGFDCSKASLPIEKAICADQTLSQADDQINDAYTFLRAQCRDVAAHADLRATQRAWLAGIRKDYGEGSPEALDRLRAAYRARNDVLVSLLAGCNSDPGPVLATVRTVQQPGEQALLFVETNPPESGWRINKVLFRGYRATPPLEFSGLKDFFAKHRPVDRDGGEETFSLVSNKGNLLVLHVSGTDCQPDALRCSPYDTQYLFDIRTGRVVSFEELYTDEGAHLLSQRLKEKLLDLAKSRLAAVSKADAEAYGDQYRRCIDNWVKFTGVGVGGSFTADGRLQFGLGNCSSYDPYGAEPEEPEGTALDNLTLTAALPELRPYLSAYGKSLLVGEADVREPVPEAPLVCKKEGGLEVRRSDRAPAPGIQASAGERHYLLLTPDGKLWGWGEGQAGELGPVQAYNPVPLLLGTDYAQAGGGQFYTAAIRHDGTLWTWGSNYEHRLGDGTDKPSAQPVRIGEGFVSLKVESYGAMALKQDGTVWGWGSEMKTPQQLMADVAEIEYGLAGERLMLKKDGSLWSLGGFSYPEQKPYDATSPRLIGKGFTRLPVHHGDLAYKADGSLWAWERLLYATFRLGGEESFEQPVNIGSGFVNMKVGGDSSSPYLVALKADGSLWLAKNRGTVTRLNPVGCGYADVVAGGQYLLALKQDGSLEVWSYWATPEAIAQRAPREQISPWGRVHPTPLGKGYTRLFQVGDLWGSGSARAIALSQDGTVWLFNPPRAPAEGGPKDWLTQVLFPQEANIGK